MSDFRLSVNADFVRSNEESAACGFADWVNGERAEQPTGPALALAALPDGRALSGFKDGTLWLWDPETGERRVFQGHTMGVTALAVLPDSHALSGSRDWSVIVWDVARGAPLAAFVGNAAMTCVARQLTSSPVRPTAPFISSGFAGNPRDFLDHFASQNL